MTVTYEKKLFGAMMNVSKQIEEDAAFDLKGYVSARLVTLLENEAEKVSGFLDYESLKIDRVEDEFPSRYEHILSRDEQPLWRFLLGLLPFVPRAREMRVVHPIIAYRATALVGVPVEETS
jgi:hypothetical protein